MTLPEAKEAIAKLYGFDNWDRIDFYMLDSQDQVAERPYAEERLNDEVAELYAEQCKAQGACNLKRFNEIIAEKDLQIGSQEVEIREMKYEIASLMAERIATEKMYEFMVETVAREGWNARHTERGEFEEWWGKRQIVTGDF